MRLDHLLSKEEEVRVVLLSRCQGVMRQFYEEDIRCVYTGGCKPRKRAIGRTAEPKYANAYEVKGVRSMTDKIGMKDVSGDDAHRGHTRSHPEHDG